MQLLRPEWSYAQIGKALGMTKDKVQKLAQRANALTPDDLPELPEPLIAEGDCIFVADIHVPFHIPSMAERVMERGKKMKIRRLCIIGDLFNQDMFSRYASLVYGKAFSKEISLARALLAYWMTWFDEIYIIRGNHDERVLAWANGHLAMDNLIDMVAPDGKRSQIFGSIHTKMFAVSGGQKWMLAHWKAFGKNPLTRAAELARKYRCHVVDAHQHHGAVGCVEGFTIADIPCMADMNKTPYVYLDVNNLDDWETGFASLVDGYIDVYVDRGRFGLR